MGDGERRCQSVTVSSPGEASPAPKFEDLPYSFINITIFFYLSTNIF
jgi:hypothetical protein